MIDLKLLDKKNIIACSTGLKENSAISVIRISGKFNLIDYQKIFKKDLSNYLSRKVYNNDIIDGINLIDTSILTYFEAPNSYNGEDILEISVHGNILNTKKIISLFIREFDLRVAMPGEFSYRAFLNKKLALSQIEGLDLLLNAQNSAVLNQGIKLLSGDLHQEYLSLQKSFIELRSFLEMIVDFEDDIGEEKALQNYNGALKKFEKILKGLYDRTKGDYSNLIDPKVVIFGEVNAGKSAFFNNILERERAIVSVERGTTRDYVTEYISIGGNNFQIVDTAGVRTTDNEIESEGIKRSIDLIAKSFYKILVINPNFFNISDNIYKKEFDLLVISHADTPKFNVLKSKIMKRIIFKDFIYVSKDRIFGPIEPKNGGPVEPKNSGPIEPKNSGPIEPKNSGPIEPKIKKAVEDKINKKYLECESANVLVIERQRELIGNAFKKLNKYKEIETKDIAIQLSELTNIETEIFELIGQITADNILNNIFDNFCIGK